MLEEQSPDHASGQHTDAQFLPIGILQICPFSINSGQGHILTSFSDHSHSIGEDTDSEKGIAQGFPGNQGKVRTNSVSLVFHS